MSNLYVQSYKSAGGVPAGTYALGFTPTVGNTLLVFCHLTATTNTLSAATLGSGKDFIVHDNVVDDTGNERMYCLSRVFTSGDASSFTFTTSAGNLYFYLLEVSGVLTPAASGFEAATYSRPHAAVSQASHSSSFTTANSNDFILAGVRNTSTGIAVVTSGYNLLANGRAGTDVFYNNDVGAPGSNVFNWTSANCDPRVHIYAFKSAVTDPIVSTVTGSTVTEGAANRFTATLSAATNRTTDYPVAFGGTAVAGIDFDSNLANATFSTGASFVSGQIRVMTGYSVVTIDVPTVDNALDQFDRTLTMTIGGVVSTGGNILDNDPLPVASVGAGVANGSSVTFLVTLNTASGRSLTVNYATSNGVGLAGTDYQATSGTLTFAAGEVSKTVVVSRL